MSFSYQFLQPIKDDLDHRFVVPCLYKCLSATAAHVPYCKFSPVLSLQTATGIKLSLTLPARAGQPAEKITYSYNAQGYLTQIADPLDGITNYAYTSVPTTTPTTPTTGAGQLASIDGPLTNDTMTFTYDEWSRTVGSAIGGVGSSVVVDAIGRVTQLNNALGQFNYAYVNATRRLNNVVAPNGMKTIMTYQTLAQDFRVASIRHETSAAARISEHSYQYSPQGRIDQWTQQADNATATVWSYGYDKVDQLTSARANSGTSTGALIKEYGWTFDGLGNRLSERLSTGTANAVGKSTYNDTNQLLSTAGGGRVQIKGQLDEAGTVTVNNIPAQVNPDKTFTADVDTQTGQNTFEVKATDLKGNIRTNQFRLDTTLNGAARTLAYDLNGNCTQDGATTYQWDAQNRLVKITTGTKVSDFTYDGAGRRVRIVEKDGATTLSDHRYVWLGSTIAERRNAAGDTVQIRYLGVGEVEGATKRYYTRDHLGSIREVVSQTGGVLARYDYSPFGERVRVGGSDATYVCSFGYTGHFQHIPTGMALTWFRAYVPGSGRWLNRDPIGERGGVNLYAYVGNNPLNYYDALGLTASGVCGDTGRVDLSDLNPPPPPPKPEDNSFIGALADVLWGMAASGPMGVRGGRGGRLNPPPKQVAPMLGANGVQTASKTIWKGNGKERIDVENPNPGQRPGQVHYQDNAGNKYLYDPVTKSFPGAGKDVNNLLNNSSFKNAIERGINQYLGGCGK